MLTARLHVSSTANTHPVLQLTLQELQSAAAPAVTATTWDELSLSLDYSADGSNPQSPTLRLPLVKGSPYISAQVLWRAWAPGRLDQWLGASVRTVDAAVGVA